MNWLEFIELIRMLYGKKELDLKHIQQLGLLAVKIGQVHALRIDLLDAEKCRELTKLYRKTEEIPEEDVDKLLNQGGKDFLKNFSFFERKPLASASIGQVHKAKVNDKEVVVKLVKKDFTASFQKDAASLHRFLKFILFFYPKLRKVANPEGILNHIEEYTTKELDLRNEVTGHKKLEKIFKENKERFDLSGLRFPKLYEELSSEKIMVSEFISGKTFDEMLNEEKLSYDTLLRFFKIHGFYIFGIGTFHGDIHPGNIMLSGDDIVYIDTGAISTVSARLSSGLFHFFEALSSWDYPNCAKYLNEMAVKRISGKKFDSFQKKFVTLYDDFKEATVKQVSLTKKMMETIKLGVNCGMEFEEGMFPVIKSMMFLDGMVLRCNPDVVLLKDMRPFIKEFKSVLRT